ncbi:MAG: hypothetical protein RRA94_09890, partial [Bacteroidota bacterium]|nr:hypothetical protein [Bacteroidota bacterium]
MFRLLMIALVMCAAASQSAASGYEYLSPVPASRGNTRESTIIIRHGSDISPRSLQTPGLLTVEGSQQDEIGSKRGFEDGSSWARSLRSLV